MRILVVGAGGIGGYFGGRLLAAGRDVTFLVRPGRMRQLREMGLVIKSPTGDLELPNPPIVIAEALKVRFDLVLLSCKAYDLEDAIQSFAPAVREGTAIVPLLNGMRHLDMLEAKFDPQAVLGGQCVISAMLDAAGRIQHLGELQNVSFGAQGGSMSPSTEKIAAALSGAGFTVNLTRQILQEMWEKWVFIATGAAITCLMRSTIGDIVSAGAADVAIALLEECCAIAKGEGYEPRPAAMERFRTTLTTPGSALTASMFRDIQVGARIEADHIVGDLLRRSDGIPVPTLRTAFAHLKTYEARRAREPSVAVI
ncbi:2-dehydropantoate 2-reductase [Mesorhizobium sp. DCY119]|uniref:2-dehydropantoate 2-reductase n=1 Tax=Mesorhizobium sp. DCY119 TaxID=2108445 RepID=UPI000E6B96A8|nr:2-dehydropantoate 2-reductase [Mesorhizobium sp. DCY119]RJG46248.1 2-dehydropantoate 2-reductase [Mesorhizobium sp. DCY119]